MFTNKINYWNKKSYKNILIETRVKILVLIIHKW